MDVSSMMSILASVHCTNRMGKHVDFHVDGRKITVPRHGENFLSHTGGFNIAIDLVEKGKQRSCVDILHDETAPLKQICRYDENKLFISSDAGTNVFLNFLCETVTIRSVRSTRPQKPVSGIHVIEGTVIRTLSGRKTVETLSIGESALVNDLKSGTLQARDIWHICKTRLPSYRIGKIRSNRSGNRFSHIETLVPVGSRALLNGVWEVVDVCDADDRQNNSTEDGLPCYSINIGDKTAISMNGIYVWNNMISD